MAKLWRSGVILSFAGLVAGLGNYAFQAIIGRCLDKAEYGYVNSTLGFIVLLGLPLAIASTSIITSPTSTRRATRRGCKGCFSAAKNSSFA